MTMENALRSNTGGPLTAAADIPQIRRITNDDLIASLREGWQDFSDNPTHYIFMCLIFPIAGLVLAMASAGANLVPLIFPLVAGFALIGPFAALGVYEISKRREQGQEPSWKDAREVFQSPSIGAIFRLGALLTVIFVAWLWIAYTIYGAVVGPYAFVSVSAFVHNVLTTPEGWALIAVGNIVGLLFAAAVLAISVISFPLLLDRPVDASTAIRTSIAAVRANPVPMALWGLIVAASLVIGAIPFFIGLAVVVPVLGHATWRLYRKVVV